jgi:hypothetical protein
MPNTVEFNTKNNEYWNFNAHKIYSISGDDLQLEAAPGKKIQFVGDIAAAPDTDASCVLGRHAFNSLFSTEAVWGHNDCMPPNTDSSWGMIQRADGTVYINGCKGSASFMPLSFTIDGGGKVAYFDTDTNFKVRPDDDAATVLGRHALTSIFSDEAVWSHVDRAVAGQWAMLQRAGGSMSINGRPEGSSHYPIQFCVNGTQEWYIDQWGALHGGNNDVYSLHGNPLGSDDRLKHNEVDISGLEIIRQLKPQKYQKTNEKYPIDYTGDISCDWRWEAGLISQDILKIDDISFSTKYDSDTDTYYLNYNNIFVYGLQATKELDITVQEQQNTINSLQNTINSQQNTINDLLARVTALESNN